MRAVVAKDLGSLDVIAIEDRPTPRPGPGQILIEVAAAGINFADLLAVQGKYQVEAKPPYVPGMEVAGMVLAVGESVSRFKTGDRVIATMRQGAFAEAALATESECHHLPADISFADGASLGIAYQTAYFGLRDSGRLEPGEVVLVNGAAGGVGIAAVQLAKAFGATVLGGLNGLAKGDVVRRNGADHLIDLTAPNLSDSLRDQVKAATGGRGADVILDMIGGDVFDASLRALAFRGRIVIIGFTSGRMPVIKANYLFIKNITATGLIWGYYRDHDPAGVRRAQEEIFALCRAGRAKPHVMKVLPLEKFREAFELMAARQIEGRIVIEPGRRD